MLYKRMAKEPCRYYLLPILRLNYVDQGLRFSTATSRRHKIEQSQPLLHPSERTKPELGARAMNDWNGANEEPGESSSLLARLRVGGDAERDKSALNLFHFFAALSVVVTLVTVVACNTSFRNDQTIPLPEAILYPEQIRKNATFAFDSSMLGAMGKGPSKGPNTATYVMVNMKMSSAPRLYRIMAYAVKAILSTVTLALGLLFMIRLRRMAPCTITHQQIWACILLFASSLYISLPLSVMHLVKMMPFAGSISFLSSWERMAEVFHVAHHVAFVVIAYFYVWANLHWSRILDSATRLDFRSFYAPKLAVLLPYAVVTGTTLLTLRVVLSEVPLLSGAALAVLSKGYRPWNFIRKEYLLVVASSITDMLLVVVLIVEAVRTASALKHSPCIENGSKQREFRLFMYINSSFCLLFLLEQYLLLLGRPAGELLVYFSFVTDMYMFAVPRIHTSGPCLVVFGYVLAVSWMAVPAASHDDTKGWAGALAHAPSPPPAPTTGIQQD